MSIEDKYDGVKELINLGKEKGYLLYDEVNDVLPDDIHSSEDLDNIFYLFGDAGIELIDSEQEFESVQKKIVHDAASSSEADFFKRFPDAKLIGEL